MGFFGVYEPADTRRIILAVSSQAKPGVLVPNGRPEVLLPLTNSI